VAGQEATAGASFRRENSCQGGPDGGDGGAAATCGSWPTAIEPLIDYRLHAPPRAGDGEPAAARIAWGFGHDIELRVPLGTVVVDEAHRQRDCRLGADGQRSSCRRRGGGWAICIQIQHHGLRDSDRSVNRGSADVRLELKILPMWACSARTTPASRCWRPMSNAAQVADYPFTTLHPNLGMVR